MVNTNPIYKISMPHRHTVTYTGPEGDVEFEVEAARNGLILYTNLGDQCILTITERESITIRVKEWLETKFNKDGFKIIEDNTPPW